MSHEVYHALDLLAIILVLGIVISRVAGMIKVPDIILFIIAGIIIGPAGLGVVDIPTQSTINGVLLVLGAGYIIFGGGLELKFEFIRKVALSLVLLATLGVLVSATLTGLVAQQILGISFLMALLIGAVLAPTDPAALIPIFSSVKVKDKLVVTGICESGLNDATGAVMVFTLAPLAIAAANGGTVDVSVGAALLNFMKMAGGGVIIGVLVGYVFALLVSTRKIGILTDFASVLTIPAAAGAYLLAETLHTSGFMAVFFAGLAIGNADRFKINIDDRCSHKTEEFILQISFLMRIGIFILLGTHVDFAVMKQYLWPSIAIVAFFMLVARPLTVLSCLPLDRKAQWKFKEMAFMFWVRETGVMPAALVGILMSQGLPQAEIVSSIVFVAILATMLLQATTTEFVARKLGQLVE